jgi:membrane protease YdiL (CAAX protease family)
MLKKLYEKSNIWFAVVWIVLYCVLMSVGDVLSDAIGIQKLITLPVAILLSVVLFFFLKNNTLLNTYGLCRPKVKAKALLYYLPVLLMLSANLWYGVTLNFGVGETVLYILAMFCVGFLEEVIFRGLLFGAMKKDNLMVAVIVSSITFGMGHIINLINGSGAELVPNLLQVVYATAAGLMFVMLYYRSQSLVVCIGAHGLFNAISAFANENLTLGQRVFSCLLLSFIMEGYALYLAFLPYLKRIKRNKQNEDHR